MFPFIHNIGSLKCAGTVLSLVLAQANHYTPYRSVVTICVTHYYVYISVADSIVK
jgi:hypothetical protein